MQIEYIKDRFKYPLPGAGSHLKMAPEHRSFELQMVGGKPLAPRLSAVVALLYPGEMGLKLVFIRRSEYVGIHSGQIAFPGGRYEESDGDLLVTALRELEEEIGVAADGLEVLGALTDLYVPPSNFLVRAYVAYSPVKPVYRIDAREVQEVLEFDLNYFFRNDIIEQKDFTAHNSVKVTRAPYYQVQGTIIWGATAMMLTELIDLLNKNE